MSAWTTAVVPVLPRSWDFFTVWPQPLFWLILDSLPIWMGGCVPLVKGSYFDAG